MEVPVEVIKPLPVSLTRPLDYPQGHLSGDLTVSDLLNLIFDLYDVVDVANADRESAAELTAPQRPSPESLQ